MVLVPAETPVTNPVLETVATPVFDDVQGLVALGVPTADSCVVEPTQALKVPLIEGFATTFNVMVFEHPFELVYVMVVEPTVTPVTTPVEEIVATAVFELVQGVVAAGVPEPVKEVVPPTHTSVPVTVGKGFTVIISWSLQPDALV